MLSNVMRFAAMVLLATLAARAQERIFSMPNSVLLFGNYDQGVILATPQS